jgi:hypothetical protein
MVKFTMIVGNLQPAGTMRRLLQALAEFPGYVPLEIPLPNVRPLVVEFLAFAEPQFNLDPAFFEVKRKGKVNAGMPGTLVLP